jgi:predicted secreted protein
MGQKYISSDTEITRKIKTGESFELKFVSCPGSGYGWKADSTYDKSIISIKQVSYEAMNIDSIKGPIVGGNYIATIKFTGIKPGNTIIEYFYKRPWLSEWRYRCRITLNIEP